MVGLGRILNAEMEISDDGSTIAVNSRLGSGLSRWRESTLVRSTAGAPAKGDAHNGLGGDLLRLAAAVPLA